MFMCAGAKKLIPGILPLALVCTLSISTSWVYSQSSSIPATQVAQVVAQVRSVGPGDPILVQAVVVGQSLTREGRFAEAAELFGAVLEKTPHDARALYGAALAAFNLERTAEAERFARATVESLLPDLPRPPRNLSIEKRLQAADALVLAAVVLAVRGNEAGSLKFAEQAASIAPNHFDAQFTLGRALFGAGDYSGAAKAFRKAVSLNPDNTRALFFLATSLERTNDAEGALRLYRELIAKQPLAAEGHLGCGILLVRRGGDEAVEGLRELERAITINPNLYEARIELGRALITHGRAGESVAHLVRASELAPGNPEPHYQLALAYRRLGRKEEAAKEEEIVKTIHESRRSGRSLNDRVMP